MNDMTYCSCPPSVDCMEYTIKRGDTFYLIAKRFGVSLDALIAANPHIADPNWIYPAQKICIPGVSGEPGEPGEPGQGPAVLTIGFYNQQGVLLAEENGFVQLAPITIVRATFTQPVTHGYLFFTPSGTETFLYTGLIGTTVSDGSAALQFQWQVQPGLLGSIFIIGCSGQLCVQSENINVCSA